MVAAKTSRNARPTAPGIARTADPTAPAPAKGGSAKSTVTRSTRRTASLSITSTPRATVLIDGVRVGETPISGRALTVGRTYRIQVERKGYRTKRETISVNGTQPIRRSYVLERERRR